MDPAARLLRVLSLLQARPVWTGEALADRLGVTTRTVRRDISRLRDLGYPVESTTHGYQLGVGGRLPPLLLDDDEAVAVAVGLRFSSTASVSGVGTSAVAALAKLESFMSSGLRERVQALHATTVHERRGDVPIVAADTLITLATACRRSEGVRFAYYDHQGRQSQRSVEPLETVHHAGRWYLVARDRDVGEWRTFRVDRIVGAELTGHRYCLADAPDPSQLVAEASRVFPFALKARVLLELDVEAARRVFPPTVGAVEAGPGGRAVLHIGGNHLQALVRFVAGLEVDAEVLDPPELRQALHRLGGRLVARHGSPPEEKPRSSARAGQDLSHTVRTVAEHTNPGGTVSTRTAPRLFGVTIHAPDVEATAAFYREVVGIALDEDRHGDGPLHYHAGWGFPDGGLMLSLFPGSGGEPQHLSFIVDDVDAAHERAVGRGDAVEAGPGKNDVGSPAGWRDFVVRDPAGNVVGVYQPA